MKEAIVYIVTDIKLAGPICRCDKQNLSWGIGNSNGLYVRCDTCQVELNIPREQFRARIICKRPYPEDASDKDDSLNREQQLNGIDLGVDEEPLREQLQDPIASLVADTGGGAKLLAAPFRIDLQKEPTA